MSLVCRICSSDRLVSIRESGIRNPLTSSDVAVTDSNYGVTGELFQCLECGFVQCADLPDVLGLYENLVDEEYEQGRLQRALQARCLLKKLPECAQGTSLLDVGAGSGILVEEAQKAGCRARGIEPCHWLCQQAVQRGLNMVEGVLPHPGIEELVDVVTLIDVVEHVEDPVGLLRQAASLLAPGGVLLVVTPDVSSVAARLMGRRWWHYRIAHIGYFNRKTLRTALACAGLNVRRVWRPGWYFTAGYLWERLMRYFPEPIRRPPFSWMDRLTVPLNLGDSLAMVCKKCGDES